MMCRVSQDFWLTGGWGRETVAVGNASNKYLAPYFSNVVVSTLA